MQDELPLNYRRLEAALQGPERFRDPSIARNHDHYHKQQMSTIDTPAKRLARGAGFAFVICGCGARIPV